MLFQRVNTLYNVEVRLSKTCGNVVITNEYASVGIVVLFVCNYIMIINIMIIIMIINMIMIMISSVDDHHHDHQHHDHHDHRFRKNCLYLAKVRLGFRV
jgi:uncharacterized membrane protein